MYYCFCINEIGLRPSFSLPSLCATVVSFQSLSQSQPLKRQVGKMRSIQYLKNSRELSHVYHQHSSEKKNQQTLSIFPFLVKEGSRIKGVSYNFEKEYLNVHRGPSKRRRITTTTSTSSSKIMKKGKEGEEEREGQGQRQGEGRQNKIKRNPAKSLNKYKVLPHHLPSYFQGRTFSILSLDGGGLRGVVTAMLLARITEEYPNFMTEKVDLIAGTSGGGILALLLAHGMSPSDLVSILQSKGKEFVASSFLRRLNIFKSKYSGTAKENFLRELLGDTKMLDLEKLVMVSAVDLMCSKNNLSYGALSEDRRGWQPVIFSNLPYRSRTEREEQKQKQKSEALLSESHESSFDGKKETTTLYHDLNIHNDCYVYEAAMRTSAAPSFYPIYQGYCDGGIISKDPGMFALSKVVEHYPEVALSDIALLSLGAGTQVPHLPAAIYNNIKIEWGLAQWSQHIINLLVYSGMATSGQMLKSMLGQNYHRVDPIMPHFIPFDASNRMPELEALASDEALEKTIDFVNRYFDKVMAPTLLLKEIQKKEDELFADHKQRQQVQPLYGAVEEVQDQATQAGQMQEQEKSEYDKYHHTQQQDSISIPVVEIHKNKNDSSLTTTTKTRMGSKKGKKENQEEGASIKQKLKLSLTSMKPSLQLPLKVTSQSQHGSSQQQASPS